MIKEDGLYKMWYVGMNTSSVLKSVGLATSSDGITWTKHSGNPIYTFPTNGVVTSISVLRDGNAYRLFGADAASIYLATSTDGIAWTTSPSSPVVTVGANSLDAITVYRDSESLLRIYYGYIAGGSNDYNIGLTTNSK